MLTCLHNGKLFSHDEKGYSEIEKRVLGKEHLFTCPICGSAVYYNSRGKVVSHFSHYPGSACDEALLKSHDVDNSEHNFAKTLVAEWIKDILPEVEPVKDKYFPSAGLLADVYFETSRFRAAIEIQFKHITPDKMAERQAIYRKLGIRDIWFFIRGDTIEPGSPYERHYYQSNNRELYYLDIGTGIFTYFKGLKKEGFDTACLKLMQYVSHRCYLSQVGFKEDGLLNLPLSKELYVQKLTELRERNHDRIRKNREMLRSALGRLEVRQSYEQRKAASQVSPVRTKSTLPPLSVSGGKGQLKMIIKETEYAFSEIHTYAQDGKQIMRIDGVQSSVLEPEYELKNCTDSGNYSCFICRSLKSSNSWFILKADKTRKVFTIKPWSIT